MAKVAKKKAKGGVVKKAAPKKAAGKKTAPKKAAPKKTAGKKVAPKKAAAKKVAAKKVATKKAAPKQAAAEKGTPKKSAPRKAAPVATKPKSALKKTTLPKRPPAERDVIDEQALRARSGRHRSDDAHAFLPDPSSIGHRRVKDDFAEGLGEEFVATVTSGESTDDERDASDPEEEGGPFITTSAKNEFGQGTDASNPEDAEVEAFPTTHGGSR